MYSTRRSKTFTECLGLLPASHPLRQLLSYVISGFDNHKIHGHDISTGSATLPIPSGLNHVSSCFHRTPLPLLPFFHRLGSVECTFSGNGSFAWKYTIQSDLACTNAGQGESECLLAGQQLSQLELPLGQEAQSLQEKSHVSQLCP
jgi:hypothetical protein